MALITLGNKHKFYFINNWSQLHGHFILHLQTFWNIKMYCLISLHLLHFLIFFSASPPQGNSGSDGPPGPPGERVRNK